MRFFKLSYMFGSLHKQSGIFKKPPLAGTFRVGKPSFFGDKGYISECIAKTLFSTLCESTFESKGKRRITESTEAPHFPFDTVLSFP